MYPEINLLPKDPCKNAKIRGFCEVINSSMQPYQNLRLLEKMEEFNPDMIKFI